jgi:glycosyltransferase involved in cell wall biosynthesis
MRIGVDISQIVYTGTGVARFTRGLVEAILALETKHEWVFFFSSHRRRLLPEFARQIRTSSHTLICWPIPPKILGKLWNSRPLGSLTPYPPFLNLDIFLSSDWTQPPPGIARIRATIVHDLIFRRYPETVDPVVLGNQYARLKRVTEECAIVICDSQTTSSDFRDCYPESRARVYVLYPGIDHALVKRQTRKPSWMRDRQNFSYFLTVGKLEPRKNLHRLVEAFTRFCAISSQRGKQHHLCIAGPKGWGDVNTPAANNVHLLGEVPDEELFYLYRNATAFVFPSIYEGLGIPMLEAMAVGCPTIVSNTSSLAEIAQLTGSPTFDPFSVESICQALQNCVDNPHVAKTGAERARVVVDKFRWESYLDRLVQILASTAA